MKSDNALKKHHFWILLGLVPLLAFIGMLMLSSNVGGKIADEEKKTDEAKKKIASKPNPKPKSLIEQAKKTVEIVSSKQGDLHKANWDRQKYLFTWPAGSPKLKKFDQMNLKFGDPLPTDQDEFGEFRKPEAYIYEFSSLDGKDATGPGTGMADRVAPTQFKNGWKRVLRYVAQFDQKQLTKDQVWLMMEDIWVQRSLLSAIRSVNEEMAGFHRAKRDKDGNIVVDESYDEKGNKLATDRTGKPVVDKQGNVKRIATPEEERRKALFRNRTWAVELELVREGNSQRLTGTLTNLSDRLQLMGVGNVMKLHVWFSKDPSAQPMIFKIGGEYLPGVGATKVVREPVLGPDKKPQKDRDGKDMMVEKTVPANVMRIEPLDDHILPAGTDPNIEIVRVEHVFDLRTVPIKRIDAVALGKTDSRNSATPLLPPNSPPFEKDPSAETGGGTDTTNPMGGGAGSSLGGPPMPNVGSLSGPPGGIPGSTPGGQQTATGQPGGGPLASVIDGNKKRYLLVSEQVRRMPVGIVLVVDQTYMQDVLLAFANSPLRFQITQVEWKRFREPLEGATPSGGSTGNMGGGIAYSQGRINFGGSGDPDAGPMAPFGSMKPLRPGIGSLTPGPVTPSPGMITPPGSGGPAGLGPNYPYGGGSGYGSGYGAGNGNSSSVSESQITSGLVELSVYGIVSLYEKYTEPPKEGAAPGAGASGTNTPAPTPGPTTPAPAPAPMQPGPTTQPPKKRRRLRK